MFPNPMNPMRGDAMDAGADVEKGIAMDAGADVEKGIAI